MRSLLPPPDALLDHGTSALRTGSFRGGLPRLDFAQLAPGRMMRMTRQKRWLYVSMVADEVMVTVALVRLGYAANAFAFVYSRGEGRMLADRKALGLPLTARVSDEPALLVAEGRLPGAKVSMGRRSAGEALKVEARVGEVEVSASLDASGAPPPIAAIAMLPEGRAVATEKGALLAVRGEARVGGRRFSLDGGLGGYDYSNGLLPRRTVWRWGFALGRARSGERVGLNLVEGMSGAAECALWVDGEIEPLAEGRFTSVPGKPLQPWTVRTEDGAVDLRFAPGGAHEDNTDLRFLRARFLQPAGTYTGTIRRANGRVLEIDEVLGVTELQDVLW
ncbi:DUF2804 domain-containing protein [Chondromyces apiculatus]|nr:DUF2804 domain-containing protein [Chondromyces apiculatus]